MTNDLSKNILIIDDSVDMRSLLKQMLEAKGYETDCSANGEEALRLLNSSPKIPDLILLDLRMPVMDGFDFLESQQRNPRIKDIPVIVMTGEEDVALTDNLTSSAVLKKPLNMRQIVEAVDKYSQLH